MVFTHFLFPSFASRAPNPDYSMSVFSRRAANIERATLVFEDLVASKVPVDAISLTTYMTGRSSKQSSNEPVELELEF